MRQSVLRLLLAATVFVCLLTGSTPAGASSSAGLAISQIYGGGGNANAPYLNDYVELFNRGTATVSLTGYSVQYASATGTGNFAANPVTVLSGSLAPGQYYLVRQASGGATGVALPTPDATGTVNMSGTGGKVILASTTTGLACNGGSTPCNATQLAQIVDFVGYDGANFFEGASAAPTLSNTSAGFRANGGCTDTDNNGADFAAGAPAPRNSATTAAPCPTGTNPSGTGSASPSSVTGGGSTLLSVEVTPGTDPASTGLAVTCDLSTIGESAATAFTDGGSNTFTHTATVAPGTTPGSKSLPCSITDAQSRAGAVSIALAVEGPFVPIHDIQGASHVSSRSGEVVSTNGIVTARSSSGFWIEAPDAGWDADDATSEGIFVFTTTASAAVGDAVHVNGRVQEFRPGGAANANLTTTELSGSPTYSVTSTGNPLPSPIVAGTSGRIPPDTVIEDDALGDVETSGVFDPASDGLDFWESLEGMRVQVDNPVAVGPTNSFGETQVVGDDGANASLRTPRGGVLLRSNDGNPERIVVDDSLVSVPAVNVGDHYLGGVTGVLDYNFGNFFLEATTSPVAVHDGVAPESTVPQGSTELAVSTFNVENLAPSDPQSKFDRLASLVVHNLQAPDIISVEEVQDNSGATDNGIVAADQTIAKLVAAIQAAGGPNYDTREIDPVNDQDGGQPGGNIRQVFFFRTDRGLSFVDRAGGGSTVDTTVVSGPSGPQLSASPGRIAPANSAWTTSRKPLAGEFMFRGHHLFVIANHFNSKGGDDPLEGRFQPPTRSSETQRHQQAQVVHGFVADILAQDANASIVVDGDLNDFEWSDTVAILENGVLHDLMDTLPENERYSYVFEGNSQTLDHILVSDALAAKPLTFDPVHVNAEFADQASDHDPSVVRIELDAAPTVFAGGPYSVAEGGTVTLTATGHDDEGGPLLYAWDLDGNGSFETAGQNVPFSADDGPASPTVKVQVTDPAGRTDTDSATVTVTNEAPTATFNAPATAPAGFSFTLSLTNPADPSSADTAAGFAYAFDCGDGSGYGAFTASSSRSCPTTTTGTRTVRGQIEDKDGGVTPYTATVRVTVTFASLCDLTRTLVTKADVAQSLCDKLVTAAAADAAGDPKKRDNNLAAYRKLIDAQTGKSITSANATLLKRLSLQL